MTCAVKGNIDADAEGNFFSALIANEIGVNYMG